MTSAMPMLSLPPKEIHVWRIWLDALCPNRIMQGIVLRDEDAMAAHIRRPEARQPFLVCHAVLRMILAGYLGVHPDVITFQKDPDGKPKLGSPAIRRLRFNVTHSCQLALVAIGRDREVGIDTEFIRADFDYERVAPRVCSFSELKWLRDAPMPERRQRFYQLWTRKESLLKALGLGISTPLDQVQVWPLPVGLAHFAQCTPGRWGWRLQDLDAGPGYAASLTAEGGDWLVRAREWTARDAS